MRKFLFILGLLMGMTAAACGGKTPAVEETIGQHELTITAIGTGWDAPEAIPAGWTSISLVNNSDGMRQAAFLRLDDGKTMDDVMAAVQAGMEGPAPWMIPYGGVSAVMPGETRAVTANLPAGQYIVIDPVPTPEGVPGMALGYFMPLTVEESDIVTAAPEADVTVELIDYGFNYEQTAITPGRKLVKVSNRGPQEAHELVVVKLDEGASIEEFLGAFAPDAAGGPPPGQFVAGTAAFDLAAENYLEIELEEGATYGIVCFTPSSVHGGSPHFAHGMVEQFTVSE